MVNQELVKQLLKELEKERGCAIHLAFYTPVTFDKHYFDGGKCLLGNLLERELTVKGCNPDPKYQHDISLVEGTYKNIRGLNRKIGKYNLLYSPIYCEIEGKTVYTEMHDLISKHFNKKLIGYSLGENYEKGLLKKEEVDKFLTEKGFVYFKHSIIAELDGVYHNHYSLDPKLDGRDKIADITLKLIE